MLSSINVIINIMINVSLCLPRNQTSSNNLEIIEFLTNKKKKLFDALSMGTIQDFVWRSLRYYLTFSFCITGKVLYFFFDFFKDLILFNFSLNLFTHKFKAVSPSLDFNLRLPTNFWIGWSILFSTSRAFELSKIGTLRETFY